MKVIGTSVTIGILLAFLFIYILWPLNMGAAGLVTVLSIGIVTIIVKIISFIFKKNNKGD